MKQEMIFDNLLQKLEQNKKHKEDGKVTSILFPFERLSQKFPGWEKGHYYCITGATGSAKTKLTKFLAVMSTYKFIQEHPELEYKVFYFALEESKEEFWLSMISSLLYENYDISLSLAELKSLGNFVLSDDVLEKIKLCKDIVDDMSSKIDVYDFVYNSFGIYKVVHDWHLEHGREEFDNTTSEKVSKKYIPNNPDRYVFVIVDHISLLTLQKDENSLYEAIGNFSKHYCLKHFVKKLNCVTIVIQQQDMTNDKLEFYQGQTIEEKLEPSITGLANCKETARDYMMIIGIFSPDRYKIKNYRGYNIGILGSKFISLKILKDRYYGLINSYLPLYFNGAANYFEELPIASEIDYDKYK